MEKIETNSPTERGLQGKSLSSFHRNRSDHLLWSHCLVPGAAAGASYTFPGISPATLEVWFYNQHLTELETEDQRGQDPVHLQSPILPALPTALPWELNCCYEIKRGLFFLCPRYIARNNGWKSQDDRSQLHLRRSSVTPGCSQTEGSASQDEISPCWRYLSFVWKTEFGKETWDRKNTCTR